jgi:integrase
MSCRGWARYSWASSIQASSTRSRRSSQRPVSVADHSEDAGSALCREAVTWGRIQTNPVKPVRRRAVVRKRVVQPPAPESVERVRRQLKKPRDQALVSLLAYAGLRPGEALGLRWADIGERTILVERAISHGAEKSTKTRATRSVRMVKPLKSELANLRMRNGRPGDDELVFPAHDGELWHEDDWRNWRRRIFEPAAERAWLGRVRPYDLRHSFVSLLIAEGRSIVEVARQAGHSATMALDTYGHVFDELDTERISAEQAIRKARAEARATLVRPAPDRVAQKKNETPRVAGFRRALFRTRTGDPLLTMEVLYQLS